MYLKEEIVLCENEIEALEKEISKTNIDFKDAEEEKQDAENFMKGTAEKANKDIGIALSKMNDTREKINEIENAITNLQRNIEELKNVECRLNKKRF